MTCLLQVRRLFLTSSVVFPEPTRPSLSPRSMYSRNLDLCPSVCLSVKMSYFRGDEFSYLCENKGLGIEQISFVMRTHFIPCSLLRRLKGQARIHKPFGRYKNQVNMALFLCATMHQGDERFNVQTRGKQCAFMSLAAVITAQNNPLIDWSTTMFDNVLSQGDQMYLKALNKGLIVLEQCNNIYRTLTTGTKYHKVTGPGSIERKNSLLWLLTRSMGLVKYTCKRKSLNH